MEDKRNTRAQFAYIVSWDFKFSCDTSLSMERKTETTKMTRNRFKVHYDIVSFWIARLRLFQ